MRRETTNRKTPPAIADVLTAFESACAARGILPPKDGWVLTGKIARTGTDEKPRGKDASYLLHIDQFPAGGFENHRDGLGWQDWRYDRPLEVDRADLEAHLAEVAKARSRRAADAAAEAAAATSSCRARWEAASSASPDHPYLSRKRVLAHGIRQHGDDLLIPMRDATGALMGIQEIFAEKRDGKDKRFARGVPTKGLYHSMGKPDPLTPIFAVCEGYATGASIHECTGLPVAVAFDCGNLEPVTATIRAKYPHARIVLCCDDDYKQALRNPGRVKGEEAAGKWDGVAVWPVWPANHPKRGSDFNDLHVTLGGDEVRTQVLRALAPKARLDLPESAPVAPSLPPETAEGGRDWSTMWSPDGWQVSATVGTQRLVEKDDGTVSVVAVSPVPVWVCGVKLDALDQTQALMVRWMERGTTRELVIPRGTASVARNIVQIADLGFPVTSTTAAPMVDYLAAATHAWMTAAGGSSLSKISRVTGWHESSFLAGTTRVGADCPAFESSDSNMTGFVTRIRQRGSMDVWRDTINDLLTRNPDLATVLAAMVASPLLHVVRAKPFVLDIAADTSQGKTSAVSVGATVWADPDWRIKWDGTTTAHERYIAACRDVGLVIDETQSADKPENVIGLIYKATTDIGRVRGAVNGQTARTVDLRAIVISTGEQPIPDFGSAGGARARVLTMAGPPWGTGPDALRVSPTVADDQRTALRRLREHYGHAGPMCASWLANLSPESIERVRVLFDDEVRRRTREAQTLSPDHPIASRLCEYAALIEIAGGMLHAACGVMAPHGWITASRWSDMLDRGRGADMARAAMQRVMSWAVSRSASLFGHPDAKFGAPSTGWIGAWDGRNPTRPVLSVGVTQASDMLKAAGVQVGAVTSSWQARGWLDDGNGGAKASQVARVAGATMRVWRFSPSALSAFLWAPSAAHVDTLDEYSG